MRLQLAIDRVSVEQALELIEQTKGCADIIEVGTSLIKDYGLTRSVKVIKEHYPKQCILADIKTCDEGAYEFRKTYEAGGDIPTVMGMSSVATIKACQEVAKEFGREYMIDLLEVPDEKIQVLKEEFKEAIFCVHLPSDNEGAGLEELVHHMCEKLTGVEKIGVAGGISLETVNTMKEAGVDLVVVGGAITRSGDVEASTKAFAEAIRSS